MPAFPNGKVGLYTRELVVVLLEYERQYYIEIDKIA